MLMEYELEILAVPAPNPEPFWPTSPPALVKSPPVTAPLAHELLIWPPGLLVPTSPPIEAAPSSLPAPLTAPVALELVIVPLLWFWPRGRPPSRSRLPLLPQL